MNTSSLKVAIDFIHKFCHQTIFQKMLSKIAETLELLLLQVIRLSNIVYCIFKVSRRYYGLDVVLNPLGLMVVYISITHANLTLE